MSLPGYESSIGSDGRHATSVRPLHRRHCPAPSGYLPCPFTQPSSLRKSPRRTLWGERCVICLVDVQVLLSCHGRRNRDKSMSFFRAAAKQILQPSSFFLFLLLCFYTSGLAPRSLQPRDAVVPRLGTFSIATHTLRMCFSACAYPSFSPF